MEQAALTMLGVRDLLVKQRTMREAADGLAPAGSDRSAAATNPPRRGTHPDRLCCLTPNFGAPKRDLPLAPGDDGAIAVVAAAGRAARTEKRNSVSGRPTRLQCKARRFRVGVELGSCSNIFP